MTRLLRIYHIINALSLDVAAGAVCSSAWFATAFQIQLRPYAYASLGLTVWIIYTTDHLLDARRIQKRASTLRHQFHQLHYNTILMALAAGCILDIALLFFVRVEIFLGGVMLAGIIGVYLITNKRFGFLKEFLVAGLYTGGILLPVISLSGFSGLHEPVLLVTSFFCTALINVILFSWFDVESDRSDGHTSIAVVLGSDITKYIIQLLFVLQNIFLILLLLQYYRPEVVVLLLMNLVLLLIFVFPKYFLKEERYRVMGDAIFMLPGLALVW